MLLGEHRLRLFENRVLRRKFGPKRDEVTVEWQTVSAIYIYRVIHKYLRDFRPLRYSSRDGHAEREYVNRGRDTPSFCPTLQVHDMCTLGDAADVNPVPIKFL
jgi:hypothetical protein